MHTQCPSCKTVFNVKPEQLSAAHGKVRCSRCQTIFNAKENPYTPPPSTPAVIKKPVPTKTGSPAKAQTGQTEAKPAIKAPATPSAQPKAKPAAPAKPVPHKEPPPAAVADSEEWFDLTPAPAVKPAAEKKPPVKASPPVPEQPASVEDELTDDLFKLFAEPETVAAPSADESSVAATTQADAPTAVDAENRGSRDEAPRADDAEPRGKKKETTPAATEEKREKGTRPGGYSLPPQLESRPVRGTMRTLFYMLSNLMLIAALAVQYAYSQRIPLQQSETLRPWLDALCQLTACPMPPKRELSKIELVDNMMQSHPRYQDSLLVTATLINRANYVQPYPIVAITMTDLQQKVIAQRTFLPKEYLAGDIAEMGFTPNVEVALMLELADPGNNAVGFKFDFY